MSEFAIGLLLGTLVTFAGAAFLYLKYVRK